jgi:hypothetical protein
VPDEACKHERLGWMRVCGLRRTEQLPIVQAWCLDCDEVIDKENADA